jgi:hypothetical protein
MLVGRIDGRQASSSCRAEAGPELLAQALLDAPAGALDLVLGQVAVSRLQRDKLFLPAGIGAPR